jgi:hypothetical protein
MDCPQAWEQLGAWLDGELHDEQRLPLEAHLAQCTECRAARDALRLQDADLRRAFAPRRQASAALAQRTLEVLQSQSPLAEAPREPLAQPRTRGNWFSLLAAMAAGFFLALTLFPPGGVERHLVVSEPAGGAVHPPQPFPSVARLAVASGPVEIQPASLEWMACPTDAHVPTGCSVRTGPDVRCAFQLNDGSELRLDAQTELVLEGERTVRLSRGRLWSSVAKGDKPFKLMAHRAQVETQAAQMDLRRQPDRSVLTMVEGAAIVRAGDQERTVSAGQQIEITNGQLGTPDDVYDPLLQTAWVHEVLLLKGPDDPEFTHRMHSVLARLGDAKLSILYEDEIRRLGDACVLPLAMYLESTRNDPLTSKRLRAAQIIADVAQPKSIPLLIDMLQDPHPNVKFHAARGLERLTGLDQGVPPEAWQQGPWAACKPAYESWRRWWDVRKDRYPALPDLKSKAPKKG